MIDAARKRLPDVSFEVATSPAGRRGLHVILANAVIQWIPRCGPAAGAGPRQPAAGLARRPPRRRATTRLMRGSRPTQPGRQDRRRRESASRRHGSRLVFPAAAEQAPRLRRLAHHRLSSACRRARRRPSGKAMACGPFLDPLDPAEREAHLARYEEGSPKPIRPRRTERACRSRGVLCCDAVTVRSPWRGAFSALRRNPLPPTVQRIKKSARVRLLPQLFPFLSVASMLRNGSSRATRASCQAQVPECSRQQGLTVHKIGSSRRRAGSGGHYPPFQPSISRCRWN